jgi:hypothetical protein
LTARQVVERIQKNVGIPWREQTVDNFKDGSNPDKPLTGIVATFELLHRAAAATRDMIIVHEPTYHSNVDDPKDVSSDPVFRCSASSAILSPPTTRFPPSRPLGQPQTGWHHGRHGDTSGLDEVPESR